MEKISKIHKIEIGGKTLSVVLDNSYLAENMSINATYNPEISGMHYHALYELFIVGNEEITLFGEDYEQSFKNCILVVPPLFKHYAIRKTDHQIMISYKASDNLETEPFTLKTNQNINTYAKKIKENLFKKGDINGEITECFLKLIFCEIALQNDISERKKYTPKNESYFNKIEEVLFGLDFGSDITLYDVAKELNLSKKQTARIIRKNYNASFAEILRERRLSAAATLLVSTDMPIVKIVESVNFPTESYFYNKFKEAYNMTPSSYRKNNKKRCQF